MKNEILDFQDEGKKPKSLLKILLIGFLFILGLTTLLGGVLFKILSWEGGNELMILGILVLIVSIALGIKKSI